SSENKIFKFDKNKSNKEELKKIVIEINKSEDKMVSFITNEEKLFEFFNRQIIYTKNAYTEFNDFGIDYKENNDKKYELNLFTNTFDFKNLNKENLHNFIFNNIEQLLKYYGDIFDIDVKKLTKGTTYKIRNKFELMNLINEDLDLILSHSILTSRLVIVFYRLTYFDLDASIVSIGRYFSNYFGKSESFNINLNRNPNGYFFTDLNNKIFRGYRIKPLAYYKPDSNLELKIKFAKKLLSKKVNKNIVAESLELSIEEIDYYVYNIQNNKINDEVHNSSIRTMASEYKKIKENKKHGPKQQYTPYMH
ncbi:hypothetical protein, partial [Aliarcobacter butzleri]